jgi:hypothetical protein
MKIEEVEELRSAKFVRGGGARDAADGGSGRTDNGRGRGLGGCGATFTAQGSRRGTWGQLVERTVEVQLN